MRFRQRPKRRFLLLFEFEKEEEWWERFVLLRIVALWHGLNGGVVAVEERSPRDY